MYFSTSTSISCIMGPMLPEQLLNIIFKWNTDNHYNQQQNKLQLNKMEFINGRDI